MDQLEEKMRKYLFIIFIVTLTLSLNALGTLRVESIKELPATHTNLEVYDADGKFAPVLLVKTDLKGVGIQNVGRPTKHAPEYSSGDHHYKFYMNDNQRVIKLTHADYEPLEVRLLADFGINVKAQRVYEMVLTNVPEKEFINVVIISDPMDAEKIINGKNMGTGQSFELLIGNHSLKLQKSCFKSISRDIVVSKSKTLFNNLNLQEVEPVMITIKSTPKEADIYINNVNEGKTNKQLFKFPDTYELRLVANKYDSVEKTISVTEDGNNVFNYTLQKNTTLLTVNTTPTDCEIYINNDILSGNSKEVSAGKYRIDVKQNGYFDDSRTIDVNKGKDVTENFTLKQKTGKLQFVVEPMEAQITLKKAGQNIDRWTGSNYKSNLQVGEYELTASLSGYEIQSKRIIIELNKTVQISITLVETNEVVNINEIILAEYDGGEITLTTIEERISEIHPMYQSKYTSLEGRIELLDILCTEYLFYTEAINLGLDNDKEVLDRISDELDKTKNNDNRDQIKRNMMLQTIYNIGVIDKIDLSDKKLKRYYKDNIDKFDSIPYNEAKAKVEKEVKMEQSKILFDKMKVKLEKKYNLRKYPNRISDHVSDNFSNELLTASEYFNKAEVAQKKRKYSDAIFYYDEIMKYHKNNKDDYKAMFMKGFLFAEELKDKEKAIETFRELINDFPYGDLHNSAEYMLETLLNNK